MGFSRWRSVPNVTTTTSRRLSPLPPAGNAQPLAVRAVGPRPFSPEQDERSAARTLEGRVVPELARAEARAKTSRAALALEAALKADSVEASGALPELSAVLVTEANPM